jgi:hypothetical protein
MSLTMKKLHNDGLIILNDTKAEVSATDGHTLVISGVARGGTSMLAQLMQRLGLFLGDSFDPLVLEDIDLRNAMTAADWPRFDRLIEDRNRRFPVWGFKLPNLHEFLPVSKASRLRSPRYIFIFRDPLAIARRNELSVQSEATKAIREASQHLMKLIWYASELKCPVLLLSYEKVLQDPGNFIDDICKFGGLSSHADVRAEAISVVTPNQPVYIWLAQRVFKGRIDKIAAKKLIGWCSLADEPGVVELELFLDGNPVIRFFANEFRKDLLKQGIHDGCHGFSIDLTGFGISPSTVISVRPAGHEIALPKSGSTAKALGWS